MAQKKDTADNVSIAEDILVRKIATNGTDAIRIIGDRRQTVTADLSAKGKARYEIKGRSRQNEEGVLEVCRILADHLRRTDTSVRQPRPPSGRERGVDCEIPTDKEILEVQVTRPATPDFWKTLSIHAMADRKLSSSEAASDILTLVAVKARKTSIDDRAQIVLALDATETAVHAMPSVAGAVLERRGGEIAAYGFKMVWIVGPSDDLVFRIDQP